LKKIIYILLFVNLFCPISFSQTTTSSDSISIKKNLIEKLKTQCSENILSRPSYSLELAAQALQIAQNINDTNEIATLYRKIGEVYFQQKTYYLAMEYFFKSLKLFEKFDNPEQLAYCYINIGETYLTQNISDIALDYFNKALNSFKTEKNSRGYSTALEHLGSFYAKQFSYDEALDFYLQSLKIRQKIDDVGLIALSNDNIADVYFQREEYEAAFTHIQRALAMYKLSNDNYSVANTYFKIGEIQLKTKQFDEAIKSQERSFMIYYELGINEKLAEIYNRLAYTFLLENDTKSALLNINKSLEISNANDLLQQKEISYDLLSDIYFEIGKLNLSLKYQKLLSAIKDSIFEEKRQQQTSELQISVEIQKQEKEIEILHKERELKNEELKRKDTETSFLWVVVLFILIFIVYYIYVTRKVRRTNETLTQQNKEIIRQKNEIEEKNTALEQRKEEITQQKEEIEYKSKKLTDSIDYASRIQQALLPRMERIRKSLPESFIYLRPKDIVSGDFYWFETVADKIILAAVDCTGHGVPGAFMSMLGDAYLDQIVKTNRITQPAKILDLLHDNILKTLKQEEGENRDGMEMTICVIDKQAKTLEFAGAASPFVYIQNNELFQIKGNNMWIGGSRWEEHQKFESSVVKFDKSITFYMFSDGYIDQFGGDRGRKFMKKRFFDLLFSIHTEEMDIQRAILHNTFSDWITGHEQIDDVLVMGVRI